MTASPESKVTVLRPRLAEGDAPHQGLLSTFTHCIQTVERLGVEVQREPISDEFKLALMEQLLGVQTRLVLANLYFTGGILPEGTSIGSLLRSID